MRLRNTSGIPDAIVREVINFVKPSSVTRFDVMVKRSSGVYAGMSYAHGSGYHMTADPFVTVRIGPDSKFPYNDINKKGAYLPVGWIYNRVEALVLVMAHELRHQWQSKCSRGRVWGAKGKYSERDADAYAIKMLRAWRKKKGVSRTT